MSSKKFAIILICVSLSAFVISFIGKSAYNDSHKPAYVPTTAEVVQGLN